MNKVNVFLVVSKDWVKRLKLDHNKMPRTIEESGKTYYLNSVHWGDRCPDILDRDTTGCWYSETPSKNINSFTPFYLPPLM